MRDQGEVPLHPSPVLSLSSETSCSIPVPSRLREEVCDSRETRDVETGRARQPSSAPVIAAARVQGGRESFRKLWPWRPVSRAVAGRMDPHDKTNHG